MIFTLGCPKNDVDSEILARNLLESGWTVVDSLEDANVVIVNTCAFIDHARAESMESIWDFIGEREKGNIDAVIATGCLAERYGASLASDMPELDGVIGNRDIDKIPDLIEAALQTGRTYHASPQDFSENWYNRPTGHTHPAWAYLKISEGCDNRCSYCAIPGIRGGLRSVPLESLIKQARHVIERGARELVIIGQDTTAYGHDSGQNLFPEMLRKISEIDGDFWIRVLYVHPRNLTDENIGALVETPKVVPYIEIPIQHISDPILERMDRKVTSTEIRDRIAKLKEIRPEMALRTSVIVGFPGETDADFDELASYLESGHFLHGGVFSYSKEDGTQAARFDREVPARVTETRQQLLEIIFDNLRIENNKNMENKKLRVLVESGTDRHDLHWGRTEFDAPHIDRKVRFRGDAEVGDIVDVRIIRGTEMHLLGVKE